MRRIAPTRPVMPPYNEYIEEIRSIWETGAMTNNGPKLCLLRDKLKAYTGCRHLDLFVNGHNALLASLKLMKLEGEVITSPFTFVSTTNAIVQAGLVPVFCDIDDTYQLDPHKVEAFITEKTCAIVTPHIFGIPADVDALQNIATRHGLKLIFDGAQAFGTKIGGRDIAQFGDAMMSSFHAIKVFNSIEGGMLTYRDPELEKEIVLYRNFGIDYEAGEVAMCGTNAKMDEFRAAMGLCNLKYVEAEIAKRHELAMQYAEELEDIEGITTFSYREDVRYNHAYHPVRINAKVFGRTRDELADALQRNGIQTRKLYHKLTADHAIYGAYERHTEYADVIKEEVLDLPLYGTLGKDAVTYICEEIHKQARSRSF